MAKLLRITIGLALLVGLFPMSIHMMSMKTMHHMEPSVTPPTDNSTGPIPVSMVDNTSGSCCDAICPLSTVGAFLVPQFADVSLSGVSKQFSNSDPIRQLIYLTALAPPPKA